jgi:hypothetical protein
MTSCMIAYSLTISNTECNHEPDSYCNNSNPCYALTGMLMLPTTPMICPNCYDHAMPVRGSD